MWTVVSFFLSSFSLQTERSETRIRENGQFLMALMGGGETDNANKRGGGDDEQQKVEEGERGSWE